MEKKSGRILKQREGKKESHVNNKDEDESESDFPNIGCIGRKMGPRGAVGPEREVGEGERKAVCRRQSMEIQQETAVCIPAHSEEMNDSPSAASHQPAPYTEASVHSLVPPLMKPRPSPDMLSNSHSLEKRGQEGEGANA